MHLWLGPGRDICGFGLGTYGIGLKTLALGKTVLVTSLAKTVETSNHSIIKSTPIILIRLGFWRLSSYYLSLGFCGTLKMCF